MCKVTKEIIGTMMLCEMNIPQAIDILGRLLEKSKSEINLEPLKKQMFQEMLKKAKAKEKDVDINIDIFLAFFMAFPEMDEFVLTEIKKDRSSIANKIKRYFEAKEKGAALSSSIDMDRVFELAAESGYEYFINTLIYSNKPNDKWSDYIIIPPPSEIATQKAFVMASARGNSTIAILIKEKFSERINKKIQSTAFLRAAENGHENIIEMLLNVWKKYNYADLDANELLRQAALNALKNGHSHIVLHLFGKDIDNDIYKYYLKDVLVEAAKSGKDDVVKVLATKTKDRKILNEALNQAFIKKNFKTIELLVNEGGAVPAIALDGYGDEWVQLLYDLLESRQRRLVNAIKEIDNLDAPVTQQEVAKIDESLQKEEMVKFASRLSLSAKVEFLNNTILDVMYKRQKLLRVRNMMVDDQMASVSLVQLMKEAYGLPVDSRNEVSRTYVSGTR